MSLWARGLIALFSALFGLVMFVGAPDTDKAPLWYGFGAFCVFISAACVLKGRPAQFCGSVVGASIFAVGLAYLGQELMSGLVISGSRSAPSILNACMFMLVFGVPGVVYAARARFGFGKVVPQPSIQPKTSDTVKGDGYWFTSSRFEIEPGEDDEINPGIYGKQVAEWLRSRLEERGYTVEPIINEDWGRCLMCGRDPFMLWVGCANMYGGSFSDDPVPAKEAITWHCFATAEVFFWRRLFRKIETAPAVAKLHADIGAILSAESDIALVPEP